MLYNKLEFLPKSEDEKFQRNYTFVLKRIDYMMIQISSHSLEGFPTHWFPHSLEGFLLVVVGFPLCESEIKTTDKKYFNRNVRKRGWLQLM